MSAQVSPAHSGMSSQGNLDHMCELLEESGNHTCYDPSVYDRSEWCLSCCIRSAEEGCQKLEDGVCSAKNENHTEWCPNCIDRCRNFSYDGLSDRFCNYDCTHDPKECLTARTFLGCKCPLCPKNGQVKSMSCAIALQLLGTAELQMFLKELALDPPHGRTSAGRLFHDIRLYFMCNLKSKSITRKLMMDLRTLLRAMFELRSMELQRKRDAEAANAADAVNGITPRFTNTYPQMDRCDDKLYDVPDEFLDLLVKIACQKNIALPKDDLWGRYVEKRDICCENLDVQKNAAQTFKDLINDSKNANDVVQNLLHDNLEKIRLQILLIEEEIHWRRNCIEKQDSLREAEAEASHNLEVFACLPYCQVKAEVSRNREAFACLPFFDEEEV